MNGTDDVEEIAFTRVLAEQASDDLLEECAALYNSYYGRWGANHPDKKLAGCPIRLSGARMREYLSGKMSWVAIARLNEELIGYAFVLVLPHGNSRVTWVTQFVVHGNHQNQLVGSRLLNSIWGFSNHFAWGLASANPYAVRALEKATRRRCDTKSMEKTRKSSKRLLMPFRTSRTRNYGWVPKKAWFVATSFKIWVCSRPDFAMRTPNLLGCSAICRMARSGWPRLLGRNPRSGGRMLTNKSSCQCQTVLLVTPMNECHRKYTVGLTLSWQQVKLSTSSGKQG